ncbi:MAG TPA: ABC transporter permease [Deinococcales bacterium]|nr:ABC transporter permease [Deinococcales bacterium]
MDLALVILILASTIRFTTPLLLAALGGLYSEKSGIVNIALEGIMIFGALSAAIVAYEIERPILAANPDANLWWAPWAGVLSAVVVGALIALIHGVISIKYRSDQVISGTAVNLLAAGVPAVILQFLYGNTTDSPNVANTLGNFGLNLSGFGLPDLSFSPLTYAAFLLVPLTAYVVYRTPFGLRMRATGENPYAATSVGVSVYRVRYVSVALSGVLAGLAGAYLSIGVLDHFTRNLSAGQGFIALAALIFGKWRPVGVLAAATLFGFFRAVGIRLGGGDFLPPAIVESLPYLITILVLAGFIGRSVGPKATGKPYP